MAKSRNFRWDEAADAAENARARLPRLAAEYFAAGRKLLAENPAPADLHRLRLASKRFRYTLELFRPCYAVGLEHRLGALKKVQDLLGECNDAVASVPRIEKALRLKADKDRLRAYLERLAAERAAAFRKHWVETFDAPGREAWWTGYLARARPPLKVKA